VWIVLPSIFGLGLAALWWYPRNVNTPISEVIVEVGAEGGSVTLYGIRTNGGWIFSRKSIDQSAAFIGESWEGLESQTVASWSEALELLDLYPWHRLSPVQVHPDFREQVLDVVKIRYEGMAESVWNRLPDWEALCGTLDG
jgi:hypothetical protein